MNPSKAYAHVQATVYSVTGRLLFRRLALVGGGVLLVCCEMCLAQNGPVVDVGPRSIVNLVADFKRPYVYGLNNGGTNQGTLLAFDQTTGDIKSELALGTNPTDIDIDGTGDALYAINTGDSTLTKVDLNTFLVVGTKNFVPISEVQGPYRLKAGRANLVYYIDARSAPTVHAFEFVSGSEIASFDLDGKGIGDIAVTKDGNTMFGWRQFGWGAGSENSWVVKLDLRTNSFKVLDSSPGFWRDPIDTPMLLTANEDKVFTKPYAYAATNLSQPVISFPDNIYAISKNGELAFSPSAVFNANTAANVSTLPFSTTVMTLSGDQKSIFLYNSSTHQLSVIPIRQLASIPTPTASPSPDSREVVDLPVDRLSWSGNKYALRYDVFLGTNQTLVAGATVGSAQYLGTVFDTSVSLTNALRRNTTYYWRVDAVGFDAVTTGTMWSFRVA